ncbi:MAG: N-acetyl sugar amidotransferase [Candidatus Omnitrophota bacterium]|nr:MAG: N-acetyl sugar amidotransferase [Candidatus Omnitrophota bacterium]
MPDTRPRIIFNKDGVCNACEYAEQKKRIDWEARRREFEKMLDSCRSKDGYWDCIVPWSSGKDSSTIAYKLKFEFRMNPLLVTVAPQVQTEEGRHNQQAFLDLGFDHILFTLNPKVHRKLARKHFIQCGDPWLAWTQAVNSIPVKVATALKIPNVFYAEHGETEYGGKVLSKKHQKERDLAEVYQIMIGQDPKEWIDDEISLNDLAPYMYPNRGDIERVGVKAHYFGYYFRWNAYENYLYAKKNWDFMTVQEGETELDLPGVPKKGRTQGTLTNYDSIDDKLDNIYYYLQYIKFGFGRAVRDASRLIQNGVITRQTGLELAKKYDGEFPSRTFEDFLQWMELSEGEFWKVVDSFRKPEIWEKKKGEWVLRYPLQ